MSPFDFDEVVEQYHLALDEYVKGNLEPVMMMLSQRWNAQKCKSFTSGNLSKV